MAASESAEDLGRRAVSGVVALGAREGVMRVLAFAGDVALYRLLLPEVFGLVVPIAFLAGIIKQFSDLGLAASLVQTPREPAQRDLRTVFTVQAGLAVLAAVLIFLAGPVVLDALDEGKPDPWLVRAFSLSVLLSAFRAVPAAMLERHLRYGRLAAADVAGTVWFYSAGITLALVGAGPWALVAAHVGGSLIPTGLLVLLYPWRPAPLIDRTRLRQDVEFGAKFQAQRILLMLKDSLIPVLAPAAFGRTATGFLSWADKVAQQPLILTQLVARVSLPAFARTQQDVEEVRRHAALALKWTCLITFPFFAVIFAFADELASYIYGEKWLPAVPILYLLAINAVLVPINGLIIPVLNAIGHSGKLLAVSAAWAAAAWALAGALAAIGFGFEAVAAALAATQVAALLCLAPMARLTAGINVLQPVALPVVVAAAAGILGYLLLRSLAVNPALLVVSAAVLVAAYALAIYALDGKNLRREGATVLRLGRGGTRAPGGG